MLPSRSLSASWIPILAGLLFFAEPATAQKPPAGGGSNIGVTRSGSGAVATGAAATGVGDPYGFALRHAEEEGKLTFHSQTILVQVPVIVTDKQGNHVHGLSKADFHLFENGKEQSISSVEEIVASSAKLTSTTHPAGEFSNLTLDGQAPRNVIVIAIDTINTPYLDQIYGRRELLKYLASGISPDQAAALVIMTSKGARVVQGLTGDPAQLTAALKRVVGEMPAMQGVDKDAQGDAVTGNLPDVASFTPMSPGGGESDPGALLDAFLERGDSFYAEFRQENAIETTMNAFLGIASSLSGVPGRKSLIWATGGFPFQMDSPSTVPGGYLSQLYERTMQAFNDADISVYPVDVRGLVESGDITKSRSSLRQIVNRSWLQQNSINTLRDFADMTGGRAYYNTNDVTSSFKRAADDASSYYLLGYYLDTHNNRSGWRQLKVKTSKPDVDVRSRNGFLVTNSTMNPDTVRQIDLRNALTSPFEGTGVPVTVKWLGVSGEGGKKKAEFLVQLPPNGVTVQAGTPSHLNFDFAAAAYANGTKTDQAAATLGRTIAPTLTEEQLAVVRSNGMGFKNALELGPGQYTVRVVIRDNFTGKVGSVTAPLTVN